MIDGQQGGHMDWERNWYLLPLLIMPIAVGIWAPLAIFIIGGIAGAMN